jgi:hypothetical protein
MLSAEKAKLRSVFERTNNQINSDRIQKMNPIHTLGIDISLIIKKNIFFVLLTFKFRVLIEFFNKS